MLKRMALAAATILPVMAGSAVVSTPALAWHYGRPHVIFVPQPSCWYETRYVKVWTKYGWRTVARRVKVCRHSSY